jgi:hypothetical protein
MELFDSSNVGFHTNGTAYIFLALNCREVPIKSLFYFYRPKKVAEVKSITQPYKF